MQRVAHLILVAGVSALPPLAGMLAGWWGTFELLPERFVGAALRDPHTAGNLEDMPGLSVQITPAMILALSLIG